MSLLADSSLLSVPRQFDYRNPAVELLAKRIEKWLASLPILNPTDSIPPILHALRLLNSETLEPRQRFELLEHYRKTVTQIYDSFDEVRLRQAPLSSQLRNQTRQSVGEACLELANGYKILARQSGFDQIPTNKKPWLQPAIYFAIEQLTRALLHDFRCHQDPTPKAYLELHQLYALAEYWSLLDQTVEDVEPSLNTITSLYTNFSVVSLLDPFQLPDGAVNEIINLLHALSPLGSINHQRPNDADRKKYFFIRLTKDKPARSCKKYTCSHSPATIYLNCDDLIEKASQRFIRMRIDQDDHSMEQEGHHLTLLLNALDTPIRQHERQSKHKQGYFSLGIDATYLLLSGKNDSFNTPDPADNALGDTTPKTVLEECAYLKPWTVENESRDGMLLSTKINRSGPLRVGDMFGLVRDGATSTRPTALATIAWVRNNSTGGSHIGIAIAHGQPVPIEVQTDNDRVRNGFLMPAVDATDMPASIIVAREVCKEGAEIELLLDAQSLTVVCRRHLSGTDIYDRYEILVTNTKLGKPNGA